jgi:AraC-like DNA-binding protein
MAVRSPDQTRGYVYRRRDYFPAGRMPLVVQRSVTHAAPVAEHRHEFRELVIVTGGTCVHVCGAHRWPLRRGDVFVVSDGRLHGYEQPRDLRIANVLYEPARLRMPLHDITSLPGYHALFALEPSYRERRGYDGRLRLAPGALLRAEELLGELERELEHREAGHRFVSTALFMRLVAHLARSYESSPPAGSSEGVLRLAAALSRIERDYAQPLTVESIGKTAGMSRRHFQRVFRDVMGGSPIDYLIRLRVRSAVDLLTAEPAEPVTRIAYRVGFSDPNYFSRAFRRHMGISPAEYRRRSVECGSEG